MDGGSARLLGIDWRIEMPFVSIGKNKVAAEKCCVVFEPSSGRIRHIHRVITMVGADERSEQAITERALTLAK